MDIRKALETSHSNSSMGNFQQQYLPELLISQCVQLLFYGEKRVLLLCVGKLAFLKSGHICSLKFLVTKISDIRLFICKYTIKL